MEIPDWLKNKNSDPATTSTKKQEEKFLDKTLGHIIAFTQDTMFNERFSQRKGMLQAIEPRIKTIAVLLLIFILSIQDIYGIFIFLAVSVMFILLSKIPIVFFIKKLLPVLIFTFLLAMPVTLNVFVNGEYLAGIYSFQESYHIGGITIPKEIYITRQGVLSAVTLLLRVITSVSFVFLLTFTTKPNALIKAVSSMTPGLLGSIISVSYRYIFLLTKKVEQFIMGFKSRNISIRALRKNEKFSRTEHQWIGSRIGLLFSISLRLSKELEYAMESRGYNYKMENESVKFKKSDFSVTDILWIIFSITFMGAMICRSLI